jgi:hypothetical protein
MHSCKSIANSCNVHDVGSWWVLNYGNMVGGRQAGGNMVLTDLEK